MVPDLNDWRSQEIGSMGNNKSWVIEHVMIKLEKRDSEGGKNTRMGGWIVFSKNSFFTFWKTVPRFKVWNSSESDLSSES